MKQRKKKVNKFSNADQPCDYCDKTVRWVTTTPRSGHSMRVLFDADPSDDGIYALDYKPGETVARWIHSPYRADLRQRVGLYREHECVAFSRRSA